ncbi:Crp/Fnr family transcriptional regulator [Kibdelosporangium persicum]
MAGLSTQHREELLSLAPSMRYPANAVLLRQGESSTNVYLLRGSPNGHLACVKVTASLRDGTEALLGIRVVGDIVGELATLRETHRSATVTTCMPIVVHAIPKNSFQAFLDRHNSAWQAISRMVADRLDWANRRRLDFAAYDVPVRLARVLIELRERLHQDGRELGVDLSQTELGRLIGAKTDAVGMAIRKLGALGLIRWSYRKVTILNLDALLEFADLA